MDNRMIGVAIGLALVFGLTSLLVTALQEAWAQWKGKRGQVLALALQSFVGDDPKFARALLSHPLLVSLSKQGLEAHDARRPSYIEADSLVTALIGHLVQTHAGGVRPETPMELISAVQQLATRQVGLAQVGGQTVPASDLAGADAARPNPLFARGLSALVIGVEKDWPGFEVRVAAWYNAVNERATGWFKRDVRYSIFFLGMLTAVAANINPFVIGSRLWEDEALRAAVVAAAEQTLQAPPPGAASGDGAALRTPARSARRGAGRWGDFKPSLP